MRLTRDLTLSLLALAILGASWGVYLDDRRERVKFESFVSHYELTLRRPDDVETMRLQPQADLGAQITASMTLDDVYGQIRLKELDGATRAAWLRSVTHTGGQIDDAIARSLDAIERRPGGAFHHSMLAQLAYTKSRRESPAAVARDADRWELPAVTAVSLAPGNVGVRAFLGGSYLETWNRASTRQPKIEAMRAAMRSAAFVDRSWDAVASAVGRGAAIALLPDDAAVLRIALAREMRNRRVDASAALRSRLDGVIRKSRATGLERIELLARRHDDYGLALEVREWLSTHRLEEIDTADARKEAARVAALFPPMSRGAWPDDPRARLLRYFLDGRAHDAEGESLSRLAAGLSGVPEPLEARALALGGDPLAAQELLFSSDTRGSFEWTPAIVDIARAFLAAGDTARARKVLDELAPTARDECDALLVLRDAADERSRPALATRAATVTPRSLPASAWSGSGALPLCIDPASMSRSRLSVVVSASEPALVSWGWSGGRVATVVVNGQKTIDIPLTPQPGRQLLAIHTDLGGPVVLGDATIR